MTELYDRLAARLKSIGPMAIAVSGGVDSLTLALAATRAEAEFDVFHAISPAVPPAGTERVREFARAHGWRLSEIRAGEFDDGDYVANPYNRCFFCKRNLYAEIRRHTNLTIASGTNADDLSDYRPGLDAAARAGVRHPLAESGIAKAGVRALAAELGTAALAELPASPCLSSRIETGLPIRPAVLGGIDRIESRIAAAHAPRTVRCRIRRGKVVVELDAACLARLSAPQRRRIVDDVRAELGDARTRVELAEYRMGSAFVAGADAS